MTDLALLHAAAALVPLVAKATAVPQQVNVGKLPKLEIADSSWAIFAALMSALAGLGTLFLAFQTWSLAGQTKRLADETTQLARDTQESVKAARSALAAEDRRHMDTFQPHLAIEINQVYLQDGFPRTRVFVENIGPGYARSIECTDANGTRGTFPIPNAMAPNGSHMLLERQQQKTDTLHGYSISYKDAFGNQFRSRNDATISIGSPYIWERVQASSSS